MGRLEKIETKNSEDAARVLAALRDAGHAIIYISRDGNIYDVTPSALKKILAWSLSWDLSSIHLPFELKTEEPKEEVPQEAHDVVRQESQKLKSKELKLLGKDFTHLKLHELRALEEQLKEALQCIEERKAQSMMEQLEQSIMQEQQVLQKNQTLQRQVEELQGLLPSTSYAVPLSVHFPGTDEDVRLADEEFLPSSSSSAPLAIDGSVETECNVRSTDKEFLPSTSSAAPLAVDNGPEAEHNVEPADKDSDTSLAHVPTWGWFRNEDTRG